MRLKEIIGAVAGSCISIILFPKIKSLHNGLILHALQALGVLLFIGIGAFALKLRLKAKDHNGGKL